MKTTLSITVAACLALAGCGKESKSESDKEATATDAQTGGGTTFTADEDPGALNAALFGGMIPKIRTETETSIRMSKADLTNFTTSANKTCVNSKGTLAPDGSGYFTVSAAGVDISDCFSASEFSGYTEHTFRLNLKAKVKLSVDGTAVDLTGKTIADVKSQLESKASGQYEAEQLIQAILVMTGKVAKNGADEKIVQKALVQNGDGVPCKVSKAADGPHTEDLCQDYDSSTQSLNGQVSDEKLEVIKFSAPIKADAYTSKYYQAGEKVEYKLDNWSGTVTYNGADKDPSYDLTDGGSGKVQSLDLEMEASKPKVEDEVPPDVEDDVTPTAD